MSNWPASIHVMHSGSLGDLQPPPDHPDISHSDWGFLPDYISFVPGLMATRGKMNTRRICFPLSAPPVKSEQLMSTLDGINIVGVEGHCSLDALLNQQSGSCEENCYHPPATLGV